jgi:methyl-accepting chemotaxis protein
LSQNTETIAPSVGQQDEATTEIARSVLEAAAGAREVAANISGVNDAAEEADRSAQEVLSASQSLSAKSTRLTEDMKQFIALAKAV